jgi:TolB-like protein
VDRDYVVAIHPFTSHGSDDESTGLARGLTEDIGTALSRFQTFTVRTSKEADARYAVEGGVRRSGNSIRVSARLIDIDTGANVWAENYDRTLGATSFFDLQDEITARLVSTVGSNGGPLVKAMASPLRERPVAELSLHELVLRCTLYFGGMRIEEHALLRTAFEKALADQPNHALGWASLAGLYEGEVAWGMNPLPDSMDRATQAGRRSVEIDPACQFGWGRLMGTSFHTNDRNGMKNAGDRVIALNPLNQNTVGVAGLYFAFGGDWERGIPMVRRAIDFDPNHYGLLHIGLFLDHYRKKEYEEALAQAKRINAFETALVALALASAAGQLGRADEARAALDALDRNHPKHNTVEAARAHWAWFLRDNEFIDRLIEGFEKARALVAAEPLASSAATKARSSHSSADEARQPALGALQSTPRHSVAMSEGASSGSSRIEQPTSGSSVATSPGSGRTASIAVLPFSDMSAAKDQDWFCDGIAEEILNALAGLKGLSVAARASAFSFRGKGDDLKAIGDKLNVTTVLDGSVRRAGDQLRITVRLSDVANGYQLWSERYDRSVNDIFDVQDEIAKAVAGRLRVTLGDDPASLPRVIRHTENQKAYHLYLRGRHHWYSRRKDALEKARDCFEEAIKLDPEYALAYVGLADLYTAQGIYAYAPEREVGPKARAAVERALAINGQLADAYRAMGFMQIFIDWDVRAAERNFQKALALDPTSALSHTWLGWPTWPGREEVAMAAVRRAQELDPLNPYINSLVGAVHDFWGHAEEGLEQSLKALDIDSNYLVALYIMGGMYSHLGRHDEALDLLGRALQASGRAPFFLGYLGWEQASAGRTAEARETLAELDKRAATEYVSPLFPAMVHSGLAEMDRAFELLEEAVRTGNCWIGCPQMRMFDGFRKDPRFVEHLRRIGHPDIPVEG